MPKQKSRERNGSSSTSGNDSNKRSRVNGSSSATTKSDPALPSLQDVNAYAQELLDKYAKADNDAKTIGLSFQSLYRQKMNPRQQVAFDKYLDCCVEIYDFILENGRALDPGCELLSHVNCRGEKFSIDNARAHLYFEEETNKGGAACRGDTRTDAYEKKFTKMMKIQLLFSVIDADNMALQLQREVTKKLMKMAAILMCKAYPKTLADGIALDMAGLPAATQTLLYTLVNDSSADPLNGGGCKVWDLLRTFFVNSTESGMQESLVRCNFPIAKKSNCHEQGRSRAVDYFILINRETLDDVDEALLMKSLTKMSRPSLVAKRSIPENLIWPGHFDLYHSPFVTCVV